jgi:hypothetical protein
MAGADQSKVNPKQGRLDFVRLVSLVTVLWAGIWIVPAAPHQTTSAVSAHLSYREVDFVPMIIEIPVKRDEGVTKDPPFRGRRIFHGIFQLSADTNLFLPFAWDIEGTRLHMDLNRNRDLTDDASSPLLKSNLRREQLFRDIRLRFPSAEGDYQVLVDAHLYEQGNKARQVRAFFYVRSLWEGCVELRGKPWYVAIVGGVDGSIGPAFSKQVPADRMILRPWADREWASLWWHAQMKEIHGFSHLKLDLTRYRRAGNAEIIDAFNLPGNLFLDQQGYQLEYRIELTNGMGQLAIQFHPTQPALGKLQFDGEFVHQVVLDPGTSPEGYTCVFQMPTNAVEVPTGQYPLQITLLRREGYTNSAVGVVTNSVSVAESNLVKLQIGGPLVNTAKVGKPALGTVPLTYSLINDAGVAFDLMHRQRSAPPVVEIRQDHTVLDVGIFSYG